MTIMKVLLLNGSPRKEGCTYTALTEIAETLKKNGVEAEIFQAGDPSQENVAAAADVYKRQVQGDPFASPSHISVKLSHRDTGFPAEYYKDSLTRITLGDFLNRQFEQQVNRYTCLLYTSFYSSPI